METTTTKREVVIWVVLVLISITAALLITVVSEKLNNPVSSLGAELHSAWQPNFRQILLALGYESFLMFLKILVVLGAGRVIFLLALKRIRIRNRL